MSTKKSLLVFTLIKLLIFTFLSNQVFAKSSTKNKGIGALEVVAEIDINPGNVAVSKEGRIFSSIHPARPGKFQLVEITGKTTYVPFPSKQMQSSKESKSDDKFDAPLGIVFDSLNRLWVADLGLSLGQTRVFAYDIDTKKQLLRFDIPTELAPAGSFVQDLVIDEENGFIYLADVVNPAIIVININNNTFRRYVDLPSMQPEDIDMVINNQKQFYYGKPFRIGLDPITLSADKKTLYFGAMHSTNWYQLPTQPIRNDEEPSEVIKHISLAGKKPLSDGAATDDHNHHYFTNVQNSSIDKLSKEGNLSTLKKDSFFDWPDSVRIHGDWLYIAANQVYKSPDFTGGEDRAVLPFRILKLKYR